MKKKGVLFCIILVAVLAVVGIGGWKMGWFADLFVKRYEIDDTETMQLKKDELIKHGEELIAVVSGEEEAGEIAALYNMELVSFADGVAVYTTDEPVQDVISRGKEAGYPELSINFIREAN